MVLTGPEIEKRVADGRITVDPYDPKWVGSNSLDLHLDSLATYAGDPAWHLWPEALRGLESVELLLTGHGPRWFLQPGRVYLGSTEETVGVEGCTWMLGLRSSAGRLGLDSLAGVGDDGFKGKITVELTVAQPLWLQPGSRLFQLTFFDLVGERRPYAGRYQGATGVQASKLKEEP